MPFSSRFPVAVHMLLCVALFQDSCRVTSNFLSGSLGVNPVIIRNMLVRLSAAGMLRVQPGVGGAYLAKAPEDITLRDVFRAVEKEEGLFHFHEHPNPECPVGKNIHRVLDDKLDRVQDAMEEELQQVTLARLLQEIKENP